MVAGSVLTGCFTALTTMRRARRERYTPYGEMWVEQRSDAFDKIPFRFTAKAKEWDTETGFHAFPARYYDPRRSRWLSADPALALYMPGPSAGAADLPGEGGVFAPVNLNVYHYGANNPLRYVDPTGNEIADITGKRREWRMQSDRWAN